MILVFRRQLAKIAAPNQPSLLLNLESSHRDFYYPQRILLERLCWRVSAPLKTTFPSRESFSYIIITNIPPE